jgi:hypothetical protein
MATTMWSRRTFSIATDDLAAFTGDEFTTIMGGLTMDLVSAPIQPGLYAIRLTTLMGGIRIFLPAYAKVELHGASFWGGKRLYQSSEFWHQMQEAFAGSNVHVPTTPRLHVRGCEPPSAFLPRLRAIISNLKRREHVFFGAQSKVPACATLVDGVWRTLSRSE